MLFEKRAFLESALTLVSRFDTPHGYGHGDCQIGLPGSADDPFALASMPPRTPEHQTHDQERENRANTARADGHYHRRERRN
jgi:hypothetical protein